jgi:hypothetical protein
VRPQPASRVAARRHRLRPRLPLRRRESRLGFLRTTAGGTVRQQHARRIHCADRRSDMRARRARLRRRGAGRGRLADLRRHERRRDRPGSPRPKGAAIRGACSSRRRHVARPENDPTKRTAHRDPAADARPAGHPTRGHPFRRLLPRRSSARGSRDRVRLGGATGFLAIWPRYSGPRSASEEVVET